MIRFLLATLVYRFANGLLFLSVAWHLVRGSDNGAMSLAISSVAGFLPAVVIAPFARRLLERVDSRKLTLAGVAALSLLSVLFVPILKFPLAVLAVNFALLLVFFLLEGTWDTLLATFAVQLPPLRADALNARQSAATQAGLMLGGLPLGLLTQIGGSALSFYVAAGLYVVSIALLLLLPPFAKGQHAEAPGVASVSEAAISGGETSGKGPCSAVPWFVVMTLAMVWPCLTLVNMALPLLANAYGMGAVEHAAILDAMIGLGMAFVGVFYGVFSSMSTRVQKWMAGISAIFVPLPFFFLQVVGYQLWPLAICFFLCGTGFGLFRVSVRKQLIATQPARRVGQIVFACNAYGFPVLTAGAFLYALTWRDGAFVPLAVFTVFALVGVRTMLFRHDVIPRSGATLASSNRRTVPVNQS